MALICNRDEHSIITIAKQWRILFTTIMLNVAVSPELRTCYWILVNQRAMNNMIGLITQLLKLYIIYVMSVYTPRLGLATTDCILARRHQHIMLA